MILLGDSRPVAVNLPSSSACPEMLPTTELGSTWTKQDERDVREIQMQSVENHTSYENTRWAQLASGPMKGAKDRGNQEDIHKL